MNNDGLYWMMRRPEKHHVRLYSVEAEVKLAPGGFPATSPCTALSGQVCRQGMSKVAGEVHPHSPELGRNLAGPGAGNVDIHAWANNLIADCIVLNMATHRIRPKTCPL